MLRRWSLRLLLAGLGGACLLAGAGAAWWYGRLALPNAWVESAARYAAGRWGKEAGFELRSLEVRRCTGRLLELGTSSVVASGNAITWHSLRVEQPLALWFGGSTRVRLAGLEVEFERPGAKAEALAESTEDTEPMPPGLLLALLETWCPGGIEIVDARLIARAGAERQDWLASASLGAKALEAGAPNPELVVTLRRPEADFVVELKARRGAVPTDVEGELSASTGNLEALRGTVLFWTPDASRVAFGAGGSLKLKATGGQESGTWKLGALSFDGAGLSATADGVRVEAPTITGAIGDLRRTKDAWRVTLPELRVVRRELGVSLADLALAGGVSGVGATATAVRYGDAGTTATARDVVVVYPIPGYDVPSALVASGASLALGPVEFTASGGNLAGGLSSFRIEGGSAGVKLEAGQLRASGGAGSGQWAAEFPALRGSADALEPGRALAWSLDGAGWLLRPGGGGAPELQVPCGVALAGTRAADGGIVFAGDLDVPHAPFEVRSDAVVSTGEFGGRFRFGGTGEVLGLEGGASVRAAKIVMPGDVPTELQAPELVLTVGGVSAATTELETLQAWLTDLGRSVPRPPSLGGCAGLAWRGVVVKQGGETQVERLAGQVRLDAGALDAGRGWTLAVDNGRGSAGPLLWNRLTATGSGGLAGGSIDGRVFVRGTDVSATFQQAFSWADSPRVEGTVSVDNAALGDVEPWLKLAPQLKGWGLGGRVAVAASTRFEDGRASASGSVRFTDVSAKAPEEAMKVRDFDGEVGFTMSPQGAITVDTRGELTLAQLSSGTLAIENARAVVNLAGDRISITGVRAGGFGGQVFVKPLDIDLKDPKVKTSVVLDNVALDLVLASFPDLPVKGEGRVFGELPVSFDAETVDIGNSRLRPGKGGKIRLEIPEFELAAGLRPPWWQPVARAQWDVLHRTQTALRVVEVEELMVEMTPDGEPDTGLRLRTEGGFRSPEVNAHIGVDIRIRGELAEIIRIASAVGK